MRFGGSSVGKLAVLSSLASLFGCQRTGGKLSPQYDEASAPRAYHFRNLYPTISSVFGTRDGKRLWAVGEAGTILESSDGEHWAARTSGTPSFLNSIFGTGDGKRLWAVGEGGTILESSDGEHWAVRDSGTPDFLNSIFVSSDGKRLWAVGDEGTILESSDGEHWAARTSGTSNSLFSIYGSSDGKRLWAVGEKGTILESNDGEHWSERTSGTANSLYRIFGTSDGKRLWAVGQVGTILESSDGEHWNERTSGSPNDLNSIFVSSDGKRLWVVGDLGTILESSDGEHWNALTSGTPGALGFIFGTSDGKRLWAVGKGGTILESTDGEHWNLRSGGPPNNLYSIFGTGDGKKLWAVGDAGAILESPDGEHWNSVASGTQKALRCVAGSSDGQRLWAVGEGGTILASGDGEHWSGLRSGTQRSLYSIFATSDGKRQWAVGEAGTILESSDGERWKAQSSGTLKNLRSVFGTSDGKRLWAVGGAGTILASNDGALWNARPSAMQLDLWSIFGTSDGRRLWAAGDRGAILESSDGEHWNEGASGTLDELLSIFATGDGKRLWAVGQVGTFLQSSDGEHWNARGSGTANPIGSVFGTSDGKRVWAVGGAGAILEATELPFAPFIREAHLNSSVSGDFLEISLSGQQGVEHIFISALNDYEYDLNKRGQREWPVSTPCAQVNQTDRWNCRIDNSTLHPEIKGSALVPTLHFSIMVSRNGGEDTYNFAAPYNPWAIFTDHPWIVSAAGIILILTVIPTILLLVRPLWNIRLYRALKLHQIEKIDLPGVGGFLQLVMRLVTVLPWFITTRRSLDAWVRENRETVMGSWVQDTSQDGIYVPLPIRRGDPLSGEQILQPGASDIRAAMAAPRATIQIVGPGGAGKTMLARQIGRWGLENGPQSGIASYPMIPIWVDEELDPDEKKKRSLREVVKGKLQAALPDEDIDDVLFGALLEKQRLLVFVDRLSERSAVMQDHVRTIYRSTKIGLLVITSRTGYPIDGAQSVNLYPQPLDSDETLMRLMSGFLSVYFADGGKPLFPMEERFKLAARLAALIRVDTNRGEHRVPLTPLPVRLFVEQAVQLVREGKRLDDLPVSLPEVYLRRPADGQSAGYDSSTLCRRRPHVEGGENSRQDGAGQRLYSERVQPLGGGGGIVGSE